MMKMERLAFARGNAVNVHTGEPDGAIALDTCRRLFDSFATRSVAQGYAGLLDVSAGKDPAPMPVMVDQKKLLAVRMQYNSRAGDVAGMKLIARERRSR